MTTGYPDWTRAIRLLAIDGDGNPVTILADEDGQLYSLIKGEDAGGTLRAVRVDDSGQMVMVPRGESGHYLAVDSDGFLTAVFKGLLNGTLTTVAVDDRGYLATYMVDDESQWGNVIKVGNAELAARLSSPVSYDWRGKVLWWTDFRDGIGGMHVATSGTGAAVALDPAHHMSGGYSVKLTGGSDGARYAYIHIAVDVPPTDRVGVYVRWSSDVEFDFLNLQMQIYDGAKYHEAYIRYDRGDNELDYSDSERAWQSLAAQKFHLSDGYWHGLKLVVDKATDKYVRALAGSTEHDMSALDMYNTASAVAQRLLCSVSLYSNSGDNDYAWIDAFVITVGEPE